MPQPNSDNIVSTPSAPYQNYDATSDSATDRWVSVDDNSGPASLSGGRVTGDFPSDSNFQQT